MKRSDQITGEAVDAAIAIHQAVGPGLFESVYEQLLCHELGSRGLRVERQVPVPLQYRGLHIPQAYRLDLLVESMVIIEIKSTERSSPIHARQVLTYLRLMQLPVGLVINFGMYRLVDGVERVLNDRRTRD